jgi:hypothetical protein
VLQTSRASLGPDRFGQAIREMLPVSLVGCIRSTVTVSGKFAPPVRLLSYNTSSFLQGAKEKGGVGVWSFLRLTPEAAMRPALALHTALVSLVSPSSTRHSLPDRPHRTSLSHPTNSLTASVGLIVPAVR